MPIPDFYDCLLAEGIETARQMAAIAEAYAKAMAQHVATLEKTLEGARRYRGEQKRLSQALADLAAGRFSTNEVRTDLGNSPVQAACDAIDAAGKASGAIKKTLRDQILDRYAAAGDDHGALAFEFGLIPASVSQWIRDAREQGDNRAAQGDVLKVSREEAEEANLRAEFRREGTGRADIIFPEDDQIGKNLAVLRPATGDVRTEWGHAVVPPYWIDALACLNDQREVPGAELIEAGKFPSERSLLRDLRSINERLAEAKLYILADSTHYQLCRLL